MSRWLAELPPGTVCGVFGLPGSGKSRALKEADKAGAFARRLVFDPYGKRDLLLYRRWLEEAPPWPGLWCRPRDLVEVPELLDRDARGRLERQFVVDPGTYETTRLGWAFSAVCEVLWNTGGIDVIGEEAALWSRNCVRWLNQIASGGRHARMRVLLVTQEWGRLLADARDNLNAALFFSPVSARYRTEILTKCGPEVAEAAARLAAGAAPVRWRAGAAAT